MTGVQDYGTEFNPGSLCKDIFEKADGKHLSDGVYWIGIGLSGINLLNLPRWQLVVQLP